MNLKSLALSFVVLHIVLAAGYARVTPYRTGGTVVMQGAVHANDIGAPDERQHANYIAHILKGEGLPVFNPHDPHLYESYQSHQPPLYYVAAAGYAKVVGARDPAGPGSGFLLRLLNALIGGAGVGGVWYLALWGLKNESVACAATAFAAFLPMNVALSGAVSNDPLLICLCTWCLAWALRGYRDGWPTAVCLWTGGLMGLAFLTKTTAVALLPAVAAALVLRPSEGQLAAFNRKAGRAAAIVLGLGILIGLPWWIRNQTLYGDPLAMKAFNDAFTGSMQASTMMGHMGGPWDYWVHGVGFGTMCSFFGVFGYWDVWLDVWIYYTFAAACAVFGVAWAASLRRLPDDRAVHLISGVFLLLVVASFVRFNMQYFQAQGRYLLPALGPISVGLACGLVYLAKARSKVACAAAAAVLFLVNVHVLRTLPSEFAARVQPDSSSRPTGG